MKITSISPKYKLNSVDMNKVGKGALIAFGGFVLVYISDLLPQIDWGEYAPLIVPMGAILINFFIKLLQGKK